MKQPSPSPRAEHQDAAKPARIALGGRSGGLAGRAADMTAAPPVQRSRAEARALRHAAIDRTADLRAGLAAVDALDRGSALIDIERAVIDWCSEASLATLGRDTVGETLDAVEPLLPGLGAAFRPMTSRLAKPQSWSVPRADGPALEAQLSLLSATHAVLRLRDRPGSGQAMGPEVNQGMGQGKGHEMGQVMGHAMQRHLADREKLLFTSRIVSVGEMASTLAHELNQPIGAVTNVLRGIDARLAAPELDRAVLGRGVQLALDQAQYAARIIARIREFTLSRQPRREAIDLARVLRDSVGLLDWELQRQQVALDLELTDAPCSLIGDEVMLQQLLVNLLRNGLEAMADAPAAERRITVRLERKGREAEIALRDTGCGLPEDAQSRLFVPFQSTKPNGMGIGLNICRSFVELHRGRLWFSRPASGAGSIFHISLPLEPAADGPHKTEDA